MCSSGFRPKREKKDPSFFGPRGGKEKGKKKVKQEKEQEKRKENSFL